MKTTSHFLYYSIAIILLFACENKAKTIEKESKFIEITSQQFKTDSIELGNIESKTFENTLKCNGLIVSSPNGLVKINVPVSGIIKRINCNHGQLVEKNQLLIEIGGNEIIDLQKDFAKTAANYKQLKNEYERSKALYDDKVSSEKEYITAESKFKTSQAMYNALQIKINATGLSTTKIENGKFYTSYFIKSPIKGCVSKLEINIGSYIDPHSNFLEIIDPTKSQVQLSVFSSDIGSVKKGQTVRFKSVNSKFTKLATIESIGASVDKDTKSIACFASINDKSLTNSINNEFIESEIITKVRTTNALPTEAIIKTETGHVILLLEKQEKGTYFFKPIEVSIGRQSNGFTEILSNNIDGLIAIKNTYNIML